MADLNNSFALMALMGDNDETKVMAKVEERLPKLKAEAKEEKKRERKGFNPLDGHCMAFLRGGCHKIHCDLVHERDAKRFAQLTLMADDDESEWPVGWCYWDVFLNKCDGSAWADGVCEWRHAASEEMAIAVAEKLSDKWYAERGACYFAMRHWGKPEKFPKPCKNRDWSCNNGAHPQTHEQYAAWRKVAMADQKANVQCRAQLTEEGCDFGTKCHFHHIQDAAELQRAKSSAKKKAAFDHAQRDVPDASDTKAKASAKSSDKNEAVVRTFELPLADKDALYAKAFLLAKRIGAANARADAEEAQRNSKTEVDA